MKKLIYILIIVCLKLTGCQEEDDFLFRDVARVQFVGSSTDGVEDYKFSFIWEKESKVRDTFYIPLRVLGGPMEIDRQLKAVQVMEYDVTYEYDDKGNKIDSTMTEIENKAKAGVHYVAFDDVEVQALMKVRGSRVIDSLPVILLRDPSLRNENVRLKIQLEVSDDFQLGETSLLTCVLIISDQLEQPSTWNYTTTSYLGAYSKVKHELMIQVLNGRVDDEWVSKGNKSPSLFVFWRGKFVEALNMYNTDPKNIEAGLVPMREDPNNPNSAKITFPTNI